MLTWWQKNHWPVSKQSDQLVIALISDHLAKNQELNGCSLQPAPLQVRQSEGHRRLRLESHGRQPRRQDHRRAGPRGRHRVPLP